MWKYYYLLCCCQPIIFQNVVIRLGFNRYYEILIESYDVSYCNGNFNKVKKNAVLFETKMFFTELNEIISILLFNVFFLLLFALVLMLFWKWNFINSIHSSSYLFVFCSAVLVRKFLLKAFVNNKYQFLSSFNSYTIIYQGIYNSICAVHLCGCVSLSLLLCDSVLNFLIYSFVLMIILYAII